MTLDSIVARGAALQPDRVAVIDRHGSWSWSELDEQVTRTADALRSAGVGPGDRVAAIDYNSAEYVALYYGAARAGAILCPLNYLSAPSELEYLIGDLEPALLLAGADFHATASRAADAVAPGTPVLGFGAPGADWATRVAAADPAAELPAVDPGALHLVLYSSGTTGRPKGACHTQRAHYADAYFGALGYEVSAGDRYLVHAPSFHCACWDHIKMHLAVDAAVSILPRFDAGDALTAIERDGLTTVFGVPPVLRALLNHPRFAQTDLSTLRRIIYGGALGELGVLAELTAALPQLELYQTYGLTEAGPYVTAAPPALTAVKPASIGRAVPGVEVLLKDPDTGAVVPDGEVGELVVRSVSIMEGYWRNPEATRTAIRDGWLHTGDLARRDADGDFHIVDRLKDMIRSGGENVYAAEVERVLMSDERIIEAAVIGLPDERWGERVVAIVVGADPSALGVEDVRAWCREQLAAYKVPKQVEFVDDLPRTGLGKVAKQQLRATLNAGQAPAVPGPS